MVPNDFLSISDYDIAIKNLDKFANNQKIKNAKPYKSQSLAQIYAITGGFSRVYKLKLDQKNIALRCWFKNPGNVKKRFPIVAAYLSQHPLPYFVDFQYIPDAIKYRKYFPVSLMEWVEGETLSKFLDRNIKNHEALLFISNEFLSMAKSLHVLNIAHGDLQSENIMICQNGKQAELKLIDYDSLYVPTLPESALDELPGVSSFQHPKRPRIMKEKADYFSELVIYLSLIVYSQHPEYWNGAKQNDKKLLFEDKDFLQPDSSKLFYKLLQSTNPQIKYLAEKLKEYSKSSPAKLLPLEKVLSLSTTPASTKTSESVIDFFGNKTPSNLKPANTNHNELELNNFFEKKKSQAILKCPKGHKAQNPQAIYCLVCDDTASFFGPGQVCLHCGKTIPKEKKLSIVQNVANIFRFKMRSCPKCHNSNIPQNAKHCTNCGYKITKKKSSIFYFSGLLILLSIVLIATNQERNPSPTPVFKPTTTYTLQVSTKKATGTKALVTKTPTTKSLSQLIIQPSETTAICLGAPQNHVSIDDLVKVITSNGDRLVLRSSPEIKSSNELTRLDQGILLKIHDGPICVKDISTGINYWFWEVKVKSNEIRGWIAEGDKHLYYIKTVR